MLNVVAGVRFFDGEADAVRAEGKERSGELRAREVEKRRRTQEREERREKEIDLPASTSDSEEGCETCSEMPVGVEFQNESERKADFPLQRRKVVVAREAVDSTRLVSSIQETIGSMRKAELINVPDTWREER